MDQNQSQPRHFWARWIGAGTLALVTTFTFQSTAHAQATFASSSDAALTYSADVASIIQENCTVCHRAGGIAPMELVTYENVRMYAYAGDYELVGSARNDSRTRWADSEAAMENRSPTSDGY